MKKLIKKYRLELTGSVLLAISGWLYWYFIGCSSGTCAITSSPLNSTLYGAFLGWFLFGIFHSEPKKETQIKNK